MTDKAANPLRSFASSLTSWALAALVLATVTMSLVPCRRQTARIKAQAVPATCCGAAHAGCGKATANPSRAAPQSCPDCDGSCVLRCQSTAFFPLQTQSVVRESAPTANLWLDAEPSFRFADGFGMPGRTAARGAPPPASVRLWLCVFRC